MNILVLNAGSSSLKYQLFDMEKNVVVTKGNIEKIGEKDSPIKSHTEALQIVINNLIAIGYDLSTIDGIGHRVVHGGEYFKDPVIITDEVIDVIKKCSDLAPLHNPANLQTILSCKELLPTIPQVAVFDTAFHQTMDPAHYLYPLPMKYYDKYKIRRYGFHGTSHNYVYNTLIERLKDGKMEKIGNGVSKVITCHVGNGVSFTAIKDGKVVETSMGMTPLEGLMMGTRCGNIDPAIVTYLMTHESMTIEQINDVLNKQSGLFGISGISNDMRDIVSGIEAGNTQCILAMEMYINSMVKYIGAYVALLGGVDAIVLTAGVMEHRAMVRKMLLEKLSYLGIRIDDIANQDELPEGAVITASDSKIPVIVLPTNEELMIAKETSTLV